MSSILMVPIHLDELVLKNIRAKFKEASHLPGFNAYAAGSLWSIRPAVKDKGTERQGDRPGKREKGKKRKRRFPACGLFPNVRI